MSEPQPKRPRLQYEKCKYCRRDKKKCQPYPREWPQKCTRCIEKDLPCSENEISKGRARSIEETSTPIHTGEPHSNAEFDRVLECIYKAKWVRQLGTHLKFVQSVNENYGIRQDILPPGSMTFGKFTNLVRCAQAKLANEAEELSKTLEENGRIAEAMLVSKLVDEGWGSHFLPCSAPLNYNIDLLRARIDRLDRTRDFATAETLQRTLVKSMLQGEGGLDVVKEIDRLQSFHAKYAAGLATFLKGWQIDINPLLLIPPISHYVDLLYPPFIRTLVDRHTQLLSETDCWGRTVLHVVLDGLATASLWHLESDLEQLLQDLPVHRKDIFGRTPLHAVCQNKLTECERSVAQRCVKRIVKLLLGCGDVEPNAEDINGRTPLSYAAENGHEEIVELLLEHGNIMVNTKNIYGTAPLSYAAERGHKGIVKLLLKHKNIDVNIKEVGERTPLSYAAENGHEEIVELLLEHGNIMVNTKNICGRTPLSYAAGRGHKGIVKLLLKHKNIDVNIKDIGGCTPLLYAVGGGHIGTVKLLLKHDDIDVNIKGVDGWAPLSYAADVGNEGIVKLLLECKDIDVNTQIRDRCTPLACAAGKGRKGIVKLLLEHKNIDVNIADNFGCTPLSYAVDGGYIGIVKLLLGHKNVDANIGDKNGRTPLSLARMGGHEGIVKLLQSRIPSQNGP